MAGRRKPRSPVDIHVPAQDLKGDAVAPVIRTGFIGDWLKRQGEIAVGVAAMWVLMWGAYVGIVTVTGGNLVPWATPRKLDDLKLELQDEFRKAISDRAVKEREKTDRDIKTVRDDKNFSDCEDYNGRLDRAAQELMKDPNNDYQRRLYQSAAERLNRIPDCKPIVLPINVIPPAQQNPT